MLLQPLQKFKCNHRPEDHGHPTGSDLEVLKVYPWKMCEAIIDGVEKLKHTTQAGVYPTVGTNTGDETPDERPSADRMKAEPWQCKACQDEKASLHPDHTREIGDCRYAHKGLGAYPREPRPVVSTHPSAERSGYDASLPEPQIKSEEATASVDKTVAKLPDWTRSNVQISLRNLRSYEPSVVIKELRKLHLRWWHAKAARMRALLEAAGLDETRLELIKEVVRTCRECRAWSQKEPAEQLAVATATTFNEVGDLDVFVCKKSHCFHLMDNAIRLSDGCPLKQVDGDSLMNAYWTT